MIQQVSKKNDFNLLAKLLNEAFGTVAKDFGLTKENTPTNSAFITSDELKVQLIENREFYSYTKSGKIVGFVAIEKSSDTPDTFYIEKLAVAPDSRHQGIGKRLMDFAANRIMELGGKCISIALINSNTILKTWYSKQGFVERFIKTFEHLLFDVCYMEKKMNQEDDRRCGWCKSDPVYIKYHDEEWGKEVTNDFKMFEFLVLESAQAGLSWITILKRRDAYRNAFADYNAGKVAEMTEQDLERLMKDSGIIRNRRKIEATITNARHFLEIQKEFGSFCDYMKSFLPEGKPIINQWKTLNEIPASTPLSDTISKDMKKRGFKFFGTTICYAHLQAVGFVNDHLEGCPLKYRNEITGIIE